MPTNRDVTSRQFAVFDIDGTLVRWQLYHAVADTLAKRGHIDAKTYRAIRDARMNWKRRTGPEAFKEYEKRLVKTYEAVLRQLTVAQFEAAAEAVFEEYKDQVYTYTRDLIRDLKAKNYLLFAISNSQTEIVEKIATYYGFDDWVGAIYHRKGQHFTGEATVHLSDKDTVLRQLVSKHGVGWDGSIAVGDSTSDIPMLRAVQRPIAFNPEQGLFDEARQQAWQIVLERKNVIYRLEPRDGSYVLAKTGK